MPILGVIASGISGHLTPPWPTNSFESIATYTATGGESSFVFSSIPSTYKHLQLRCFSRRDTGVGHLLVLQFNGDSGTNYWSHWLTGDGSTLSASGVSSASNRINCYWPNYSTNLANQFGPGIIDILDYSSTAKNKTTRTFGGGDANGSGRLDLGGGYWQNTAAISSLTVSFSSDVVAANSTYALYGIKG
jgi:hypothetical protein